MGEASVLNLVLWLPLIGVVALLAIPPQRDDLVRRLALAVMLIQFALTAWLYTRFDPALGLQFVTLVPWIPAWGVNYHIGLDGYNLLLVVLTAFLGPLVVAGAFSAIQKHVKFFYAMVFLIQFAMLGAFVAQDLFLFYLFWEAMMIPMFFIIGIWGGERRIYATIKFVLYTAFGSILMLAAVIYLVYSLNATSGVTSFAFTDLYRTQLPVSVQTILLAAFGLSFAIKVPIVPLHTWLPDAHVEAPTAGSVILAGVLLKMGTYGFMKLGFPLFPDATRLFAPFIGTLAVISIVYGACLALVQSDIKKIIAYSSISHLGFVMLGLISLNIIGIQGAVIQMVSHGLVAGGLFLLVGMVYERCHTRELAAYGGLATAWLVRPPSPTHTVPSCLSTSPPSRVPGASIDTTSYPSAPRNSATGAVSGLRSSAPGRATTARSPYMTTSSSTNTPSGQSSIGGTSRVSQPAPFSAST